MPPLQQNILVSDLADKRLEQLALSRRSLLAVADTVIGAGNDVSPLALRCAPGIMRYLKGGESLRGEHIGQDWLLYVRGNLEGIVSADGKIVVMFQNAVGCCQPELPSPRSKRGSQNEEVSAVNELQYSLFEEEIQDRSVCSFDQKCAAVYYLLVDNDGRVELSSMVIEGKVFKSCGERIFLRTDLDLEPALVRKDDAPTAPIEIAISRK